MYEYHELDQHCSSMLHVTCDTTRVKEERRSPLHDKAEKGYSSKDTGNSPFARMRKIGEDERRILLRHKLDCPFNLEERRQVSKMRPIHVGLIAR